MFVDRIVVGPYQTNCYIMGNEENSSAWIIDPGNEGDRIISAIESHNVNPVAVLLTHTHWDHITALGELKERWPHLEVLVSEEDSHYLGSKAYERFTETCFDKSFLQRYEKALKGMSEATGFLTDNQFLHDSHLLVMHTPGHTKGGICLYHEQGQFLFSGDTLFAGGIGRTDLEGGSYSEIVKSCKRLLKLPHEVQVLPGHGPATTIGDEQDNPFL